MDKQNLVLTYNLATKLHDAGLSETDAEMAAIYCLLAQLLDEQQGYQTGGLADLASKFPADILLGGFIWSGTPEGVRYWNRSCCLLRENQNVKVD